MFTKFVKNVDNQTVPCYKVNMTRDEILRQIDSIDGQLSPENLFCDGEISGAQARVKYNKLMKERKRLEKLLGEKVSLII